MDWARAPIKNPVGNAVHHGSQTSQKPVDFSSQSHPLVIYPSPMPRSNDAMRNAMASELQNWKTVLTTARKPLLAAFEKDEACVTWGQAILVSTGISYMYLLHHSDLFRSFRPRVSKTYLVSTCFNTYVCSHISELVASNSLRRCLHWRVLLMKPNEDWLSSGMPSNLGLESVDLHR